MWVQFRHWLPRIRQTSQIESTVPTNCPTSDTSRSQRPASYSRFWPADYKLGDSHCPLRLDNSIEQLREFKKALCSQLSFIVKDTNQEAAKRRDPEQSLGGSQTQCHRHSCTALWSPTRKPGLPHRSFTGASLPKCEGIVDHMVWLNSVSEPPRRSDWHQVAQSPNPLTLEWVLLSRPAPSRNYPGPPSLGISLSIKLGCDLRGLLWITKPFLSLGKF